MRTLPRGSDTNHHGIALWSHDWRPTTAGATRLVVRATDRDGGLQIAEEREAVEQFGSSDSGASLGDILGAALKEKGDN